VVVVRKDDIDKPISKEMAGQYGRKGRRREAAKAVSCEPARPREGLASVKGMTSGIRKKKAPGAR